jgi:hypothetical protein
VLNPKAWTEIGPNKQKFWKLIQNLEIQQTPQILNPFPEFSKFGLNQNLNSTGAVWKP